MSMRGMRMFSVLGLGAGLALTVQGGLDMRTLTREKWEQEVKPQVLTFFADDVYGHLPPKPAKLDFELVEYGYAFDGLARRRQYVVHAADSHGKLDFNVLVYLPHEMRLPACRKGKGGIPAFVYPNFCGNWTLVSDPNVLPYTGWNYPDKRDKKRGSRPDRACVEEILRRGYAFATFCFNEVCPDDLYRDVTADSVWRLFDPAKLPEERLFHAAWTWGSMRVRDLLERIPEIDQGKVAIVGQSRMGKNAVNTGVNDPRFALVCANCGGTKSLRHLPNLMYPSWFSKHLSKYVQNDQTGLTIEELERRSQGFPPPPFDQSAYIACIAPRAMVISTATGDHVSRPEGSRALFEETEPIFRLYDKTLGWHLKQGKHSITHEDWIWFMDYADMTLGWLKPKTPKAGMPRTVELDVGPERVRTPLKVDLTRIGTLRPKKAAQVDASNWTLGCETLDRDYADFEKYKRFVGPLGIKTIRLQAGWAKCEQEKGKFDFAWLDRIVDYAVTNGINVLLEFSYGNPIYKGGGGRDLAGGFPEGEEGLTAWDRWVDALTGHFKGRVRDWAMWNEPDNAGANSPEVIAAFNVRTAKGVLKNIPDARLAGLSLASSNPEFFGKCLDALGADAKLFTWFIYHGYAIAPEKSYDKVELLKVELAKRVPTARMRQGENGCPSDYSKRFALWGQSWSEYSQAKWDMRRMLGDLGHDVESAVFTICDFNHIGRQINTKGLLRANRAHDVIAVKRAYYAVQNVVSVFDGRLKRVKEPAYAEGDETIEFYEYRDPQDRPLYVFWQSASEMKRQDQDIGRLMKDWHPFDHVYQRPGDSFETRPATFMMPKTAALKNPVWVDLLTGKVFAFRAEDVLVHTDGVTYVNVPVYDSPCLLTEKSALEID